jgi:hypothetical protein
MTKVWATRNCHRKRAAVIVSEKLPLRDEGEANPRRVRSIREIAASIRCAPETVIARRWRAIPRQLRMIGEIAAAIHSAPS